ncbi:MAG: peptidyl-alpha-hydroxyglycine alpha-amidating lyase family protein [Chloroflexi bacterium]|nr:peptidyl-alpha-hydroxyglycine alpha-amidating lyase family protein [Chloroflexota bacterium]MDA1227060.1 peptidyl-alpha-hydroxyglycine alpha-amidating lyase family protein [Chloroflexota bacterium]
MATVGSGDYRYELVPSWPNLPKYWEMGLASDGAVNSKDEVHIFSRGLHPVTIWDTDGNFISSWGEGTFSANPHGIFIPANDNVWLVDRDFHIATEYTPGGQELRTLGEKLAPSPSFQGMPFNMPSGLAYAPNGDMFVSDGYGGHRVHRFDSQGNLLLSWGKEGTGPGEFALLHNIWVDSRSRIFICDRENDRIQIFDTEGNFLEEWTDVVRPGDVYFLGDLVHVIESGPEGGVSIWDLDHNLVTRWSCNEPSPGTLLGGHGICVDSHGSIYVTEIGQGKRVTKFQKI